jgi:hypothetical protein
MKSYKITNKTTGCSWSVSDDAKGADKVIARAKGDLDTYTIEIQKKKGKEGVTDDNLPPR